MTDNRDALVWREELHATITGIIGRSYYDNEPGGTSRAVDAILAALATQVQPAAPVLTEMGVGFKVGDTLASLRNAAGMTLRDVERAVEGRFSNALLSQMETGKVKRPSATVLLDLAKVYGVPFQRLAAAAGVNTHYVGEELGDGFATLAQPPAAAEANSGGGGVEEKTENILEFQRASGGGGADIDYEVWQQDAFGDGVEGMVAGSTSLREARHYAAVYSQDGPAWVVEVSRRRMEELTSGGLHE